MCVCACMHACMPCKLILPDMHGPNQLCTYVCMYVCTYAPAFVVCMCVCLCVCLCVCSLDISCVYACSNYCSIPSPQCVSIVVVVVLSTVTSITATVHAHIANSVCGYIPMVYFAGFSLSLSHTLSLSLLAPLCCVSVS